MQSQARVQELEKFRNMLDVPAVFGGVVNSDGILELDVTGVKRRDQPETVKASDRIHIGSCCKMITAVLFGTFVAEQRVTWETPITELFPDLTDSMAKAWQQRSVEELFYCVSGMIANPPRSALISGHTDSRPLGEQRTEMVELALSSAPHKPGRFVYSNMSYIVLGAAIDRLSDSSYENALQERLFGPLGITSAGFGPPPDVWGHAPRLYAAGLALFKGKPANPQVSQSDNPPVMSSAGTLHLNCADWAKLLRLFQTENRLDIVDNQIIERILTTPQNKSAQIAMGWAPARMNGLSFGVQGSNVRWSAAALMDDKRRRTALVACNDGRTRVLSQTMVLAHRLLDQ
ncbi:MAG: serine hydrolase domain-containing protein [Burkholderiaceae bacterium]